MRVLICLLSLFLVVPALADPQLAKQVRTEFDNCVYAAVGSQWKANPSIDPSMAAEIGFQSCMTEENAIATVLYANGANGQQATQAITGIKLQVKRTVREIMADPKAYLKKRGG